MEKLLKNQQWGTPTAHTHRGGREHPRTHTHRGGTAPIPGGEGNQWKKQWRINKINRKSIKTSWESIEDQQTFEDQ